MNKRRVDELIPLAYDVISDIKISNNKQIDKTFRGQVSSFGAAITMGSLLSAIAFFSQKNGASVDRSLITKAIFQLIKERNMDTKISEPDLFEYVRRHNSSDTKELVTDCAIALKLAMNLYDLK